MPRLTFTVDAKLLRELGERLVGRPHIALAELIKNAYDADARHVDLTFGAGIIRVVDDGHGMSEATFVERWMRIGTTAKVDEVVSPALQRPLTGSKGVGRLSVQLLAASLDLRSVALTDPKSLLSKRAAPLERAIHANIHWPSALQQKDLTQVAVDFDTGGAGDAFAAKSRHGTAIELGELADDWDANAFERLAREIWALQPPFAVDPDESRAFAVSLSTPFPDVKESFDSQMTALMKINTATVTGTLLALEERGPSYAERFILPGNRAPIDQDGEIRSGAPAGEGVGPERARARSLLVKVDLKGSPVESFLVEIPDCQVHDLDFEFRVFDLRYRQSEGIRVETARSYLNSFGGIHIYDNGFRLPYYGPDADWLKLELDHARRLSNSQLVPEHLNVRNGMLDLPSNKRVFGAVYISTAAEQRAAAQDGRDRSDALSIQITRDRLVDSMAFDQMTRAVRLSLDLYALTRAKTKARGVLRRRGGVRPDSSTAIRTASAAIEALRPSLPVAEYRTLRDSIDTVAEDVDQRTRQARAYSSLLGALATAGMTSLAYEHEVSKQRDGIADVARQLRRLEKTAPDDLKLALRRQTERLLGWTTRSARIRALFRPLLDEEARTGVERYSARKVAEDVVETMEVVARGAKVDVAGIPQTLRLPVGTYAAWTAILQNLLLNAFRATVECKPALVTVDAGTDQGRSWLRLQDNGDGMDLKEAERLFLPFERDGKTTARGEALGLGGSGLGLTIVRMITDEMGCRVAFVEPDADWATSVRIDWKEPA